jgi:hypothetical protein
LCYTIIVPRERDNGQGQKKILKKIKKGLDKLPNLWYNKITKGEGNPKNKPERKYHYGKHR